MTSMPRSPVWLRSKKRYSEAEKSAKWLGLESCAKNTTTEKCVENGRFV